MPRGIYVRTAWHRQITSNAMQGIKYSKERNEKISRTMTGKKKSPEACEKMRQARLGMKFSESHRQNMGVVRRGKKRERAFSAEVISRIAAGVALHWQSMSQEEKKARCKRISEGLLKRPPELRKGKCVNANSPVSSLEHRVAAILDEFGVEYRRQVPFFNESFVADFYLDEYKLVIEINGCYWHGCTECGKNEGVAEKVRQRMVRDDRFKRALYRFGYSMVQIWEHSIKRDALAAVRAALDEGGVGLA